MPMPEDRLVDVAKPCTVAWESMAGDDAVRHCKLCDQPVYNLAELTTNDVAALVDRPGRTCVRFFRRRDGTIVTRDCTGGRAWPFRRRMLQVAFAVLSWLRLGGPPGLRPDPIVMGEMVPIRVPPPLPDPIEIPQPNLPRPELPA